MKIALFYHSLISDWNHGNAHFLRGIATELTARGHEVIVFEAADAWSFQNLVHDHGPTAVLDFHNAYPHLMAWRYKDLDLSEALDGVDLVIVHEWTPHDLVKRIGEYRSKHRKFRLLFHDTHHRAVTEPKAMAAYDLSHYDGVLAYGAVLRDIYLERGWSNRAWTWHEAADTRLFKPIRDIKPEADLVWIGNWGDEERTAELHEFLIDPVKELKLKATVHGVRYPEAGKKALEKAKIEYANWLPNFRVPGVFARHRVTVHVPRRPYVEHLPGIPTIRPFEALACGIPLISAPWEDCEHLFEPGKDFLVAKDGLEMRKLLREVLSDPELAASLARSGRNRIIKNHTCAHRVDELMEIYRELEPKPTRRPAKVAA